MMKSEKSQSNKAYLYLDTANPEAVIALIDEKAVFLDKMIWLSNKNQSEELLQKIDYLLQRNNISKRELIGIVANTGPGSYTGLRVGITTANFLGFSLDCPVIGIENGELAKVNLASHEEGKHFQKPVLPLYLNSPHITVRKTRL